MRPLKPAFFRRHCIKSCFKVCKKQRFRRIYEHIFGIIIFGDEFNASTCVFEGMSKTLIKWTLLDDTHQCKEVLCATQSHEPEWAAISSQFVIARPCLFYGRGNLSFDLSCHCERSGAISVFKTGTKAPFLTFLSEP